MCQAETILYEGKIRCENEINVLTLKVMNVQAYLTLAAFTVVSAYL
jgi:hypothetical protein